MNRSLTPQWLPGSLLLLILLVASSPGCRFYSLTGASIPDRFTTIAIPTFEDRSRSGQPTLGEDFTDLLIDRFVRQTRLRLAQDEFEADIVLRGYIEGYTSQPVAVSGQEQATQNRVTLSVYVEYRDQIEDEELLVQSFRNAENYDPAVDGLDGETAAAFAALKNITEDIFTAATSDW